MNLMGGIYGGYGFSAQYGGYGRGGIVRRVAPRVSGTDIRKEMSRQRVEVDARTVEKADGTGSGVKVQLTFRDVLTAEKEGYVEMNGTRITVPEELRDAVRQAYETAQAYNQAIMMRNAAIQNSNRAKRDAEVLEKESKNLKQAMEIARRISKGGRVPPQDEEFLLQYSQEMYMSAKMLAMMAKKHKKHDSALEPEEETASGAADDGTDSTVWQVEAEVSAGDGGCPAVAAVTATATESAE